jgi:hypothetical protein
LELFNPNDSLITTGSGDYYQVNIIDFRLPISGTYTIMTSQRDGNSTFNYWLTLQCWQQVKANGITISYDSYRNDSIKPYGDMDAYLFTGSAGDKITIRMRTSDGGWPKLELFNPNDSLITTGSGDWYQVNIVNFILPSSGTYTIMASQKDGNQTLNYWLSLQCWQQVKANADTLWQVCDTIIDTLANYGSMKAYIFLADKDDVTSIKVTEISSNLEPCVELFGPNDSMIVRINSNYEAIIPDSFFRYSGIYTLFVSDQDGDDAGSYCLIWQGFTDKLIKVISILSPTGIVPLNASVIPKAIIRNIGWRTDTATVKFKIHTIYTDSIDTYLIPGQIDTVDFALWQPSQAATYTTVCMATSRIFQKWDEKRGVVTVSSGIGPEIHNITPSEGPNTGQTIINITGARFQQGITSTLKRYGQPDIVADSSHIQFVSSQEINATFNLTGAAQGIWDLKVTNPNGESYYFYQAFTVIVFQGRMITFGQWDRFGLSAGDSVVLGVNVPSGLNNLFVLLKKSTLIGYSGTYSGFLRVVRSNNLIGYKSGAIDYDMHIRNPSQGLYILTIKSTDYAGQGSIIVCSKLDTLTLGQWHIGQVLRPYGNDWTQVDVLPNQTALYFQTEGVGLWSTLDVYYDSLGSTTGHWQFSNMGAGYHIEGRINNPLAGRYYLKYMDSAVMIGDTTQMREYMIRVSTDSVIPPPPSNLSITSLSTYRGGTAGPVTVVVSGTGFDTSATVSLVRSGYTTVNARDVAVDSTKRTLWATFDLSSATPGQWNFKVKNPNGDSAIASRAFEVVSGGEPELSLEIIGRSVIRQGRPSTYIIRCENSGTVNVPYSFLLVSTPYRSNNVMRFRGLWYPPDTLFPVPCDSLPHTTVVGDTRAAPFFLMPLPPGQSINLEFLLTMNEVGPFSVSAEVYAPNDSLFWLTHSIITERLRLLVLVDTLCPPEFRILATDSVSWWNRYRVGLINYGFAYSDAPAMDRRLKRSEELRITAAGFTCVAAIASMTIPVTHGVGIIVAGTFAVAAGLYNLAATLQGVLERRPVNTVFATTPEDKYGPVGFDSPNTPRDSLKRFVATSNEPFSYRIDFWNHESASAPAQEVFVKDTLSTDFIDTTFNFTEFGFLRWTVPLTGGQYFNTYVDMRPDDSLIVNVEGSYNQTSREISWTFRSLDPVTMQPPEDPMAGFLPPIDSTGYQIGWVNFTAQPKSNLQTGHQITNQSWVKFDVGPWKPAPDSSPYLNTIDAGRPSSEVRLIPDTTATGEFTVKWSGQDDSLGSGIRSYYIYVKTDNSPYRLWLTTTDTMATFIGRNESRHYFYSIATDNVGWDETAPDSFDACTFVNGIASPIYLTPQDNSIVTDATPTFVWSATASSQGSYTLQYSCDSSFVQGTTTINGLIDTIYTVPDTFALIDTIYFWRAKAISRIGVHSGYRQALRFTIDANAPMPPTLFSPLNNSITTDSTPSFIWTKTASDSGRYLIQFATDSLFDSLKGAALTYDTIYTVPNSYPLPDTVYYWRVRAIDKAHNFSGWSSVWKFEIDTRIPVAPVLVEPIQGVWKNDTNVLFQWTEVDFGKQTEIFNHRESREDKTIISDISDNSAVEFASPVKYILQVDTNRNFISPLRVDTTSTSCDTFNLSERKYFWRVRAYDLAGNQGTFSSCDSFGVDVTEPSIVSLISPSNNNYLNDSTIYLIWHQASDNLSGIQHYIVQYAFDSVFTQGFVDTILDDTTFTLTLTDSIYYWRVKAIDRACNQSSWSLTRSFEIDTRIPNVPVLISPINNAWQTNTTTIFNWSQVTFEKEKHEPQMNTDKFSETTNEHEWTQINTFKDDVGQSFSPVSKESNPKGLPYKEPSDFASPVRYILQVDTSRSFTNPILDTTGLLSDTLTLSQRRYFWRVRAYDLAGNQGSFSGLDSFGIDNTAPSVPNLVSPANGVILNNYDVTFIWRRSSDNLSGVSSYTMQGALDPFFIFSIDSTVTDTTFTITIPYDTTFYWRVRSNDRAGNQSNWSTARYFTIHTSGIEEIETIQIPLAYSLSHNKPNPFSRITEIRYGIPYTSKIYLTIFSSVGEQITTLANNIHKPGWYSVRWDGRDNKGKICPNGIYFYRLETSDYQTTRKMLLIK